MAAIRLAISYTATSCVAGIAKHIRHGYWAAERRRVPGLPRKMERLEKICWLPVCKPGGFRPIVAAGRERRQRNQPVTGIV